MRVYAEKPLRAVLQMLADLFAVAWVVVAVQVATGTQNLILGWKAPGQQIIDAGAQLRNTFVSASDAASGIPFVGNEFARVLGQGTVSGDVLAQVGQGEMQAVEYLSGGVAVTIVLIALIPVLSLWLPRRVRFARRATRAVSMRTHAPDLLALRALNELPYRRLKRISADPSAAWRGENREAIAQLANLQLAKHGLRSLRAEAAPAESELGAEGEVATATLAETGEQPETAKLPTDAKSEKAAPTETAELAKTATTTTAELPKDADTQSDGSSETSAAETSSKTAQSTETSSSEKSTSDNRAQEADER